MVSFYPLLRGFAHHDPSLCFGTKATQILQAILDRRLPAETGERRRKKKQSGSRILPDTGITPNQSLEMATLPTFQKEDA
jgi:hypothetical protein